jgi:GrpB-like predicted nucleotidyltransferase (UPF0157 family)
VRLLEHIGSTSVPGLAKPIIDIWLPVPRSAAKPAYAPHGNRRTLVLNAQEPDEQEHRLLGDTNSEVNLHVISAGSPEIDRYLVFRDRLHGEARERRRYQATKRRLASQHWQ